MIGGVDKPTSGTIEINGVNIYELDEAKQADRIITINDGKIV